jgi:hypothetical protein
LSVKQTGSSEVWAMENFLPPLVEKHAHPNKLVESAPQRRRVWAGADDKPGESLDPTTGGVSP